MNGDEFDDIIIGAPQAVNDNNEGNYSYYSSRFSGQSYVIYGKGGELDFSQQIITGTTLEDRSELGILANGQSVVDGGY